MNWIICAIAISTFVILATAPAPSLVYTGIKTRETIILFFLFLLPFIGLYLIVRLVIAVFRKKREAIFFASALWALLIPAVLFVTNFHYGDRYGNVSARHSLVAKLYDAEFRGKISTDVRASKLIDLGGACYPGYSGYQCWLVIVALAEDADVTQDVGNWHSMRSNTLLRLLPAYVQYGEVSVQRVDDRVYSVLSHDYQGR